MADASAPSSLIAEIHKGRTEGVKRLLLTGDVEVNQRDILNWSPLHHSSFLGQAKITELLLQNGADVHARDRDDLTPLHLAAANHKQKVVQLLLRYGADINARDKFGRSPADVCSGKMLDILSNTNNEVNSPLRSQSQSQPILRRRNISNDIKNDLTDITTEEDSYLSPSRNNILCRSGSFLQVTKGEDSPYKSNGLPETPIESPSKPPQLEYTSDPTSNWRKLWMKATQVAKWQLMQIAVRILLVYLLELFVEHLKRFLQVLLMTYTPFEILTLFILQPFNYIIKPLWPLFSPILRPLYSMASTIFAPLWDLVKPIVDQVYEFLCPFFASLWHFVIWIIDRLQYFFAPLARLIWEPVARVGIAIFHVVQPFLTTIYYIVIYVVGTITPIFSYMWGLLRHLFGPLLSLLHKVILAPIGTFFARIGKTLANILISNYKKIVNLSWQAIQPMLNIRGFFSRLFGPIITGLKAILHWFLPESLLIPIGRLSVAIFGKDHIQGTAMYSEETALMVIFIFVVITYGSIIVWGYFFKTIVAVMYIFDETLSNKFYDLLLLLSTDPGDGSSDEVDLSFSWFLPDKWHHQIGILSLTATVVFILVFKLLRMLANGAIWLIKWRCSKNRLRNGAITTVS